MKPFPTDPMRQHSRFMAAFCDDLLAGDYRAPRAKAVCEIAKQLNEQSKPTQSTRSSEGGNTPLMNHGDQA